MLAWPLARKIIRRCPAGVRRTLSRFGLGAQVYGAPPSHSGRMLLVVSHELSATGAPKMVVEVAEACIAAGWGVVVVAPTSGPYLEALVAAGAAVVLSPHALGDESPAVVLAPSADAMLCNTVTTAAVVRAASGKAPIAWYLHEAGVLSRWSEGDPQLGAALNAASAIWAASPQVSEAVAPYRRDTIVVGASAPSIRRRPLAGPSGGATRLFLVLGSIEPRKGQDLLALALERLPAPARAQVRVECYGHILDAEFGRSFMRGIEGRADIRYAGALAPDRVAETLAEAAGIIIPSRDDPLPLVAIEALSAERLVICSARTGIRHYLADGESGFVAPDCEPEALAETLAKALEAQAAWPDIAAAGRRIFDATFSQEVFNRHVLALLDEMAPPGRRS